MRSSPARRDHNSTRSGTTIIATTANPTASWAVYAANGTSGPVGSAGGF